MVNTLRRLYIHSRKFVLVVKKSHPMVRNRDRYRSGVHNVILAENKMIKRDIIITIM
eukprot:COSAG02_NODE_826_length_16718_cov_4813.219628_19_plen_57_part_00